MEASRMVADFGVLFLVMVAIGGGLILGAGYVLFRLAKAAKRAILKRWNQ